MHTVHRVTSVADPIAWLALAGLAGACAAAFRLRTSYPVVALGVVWFFAVLAPSSSVITLREGMAEHRVYLASAGIFIAVAAIVSRWLSPEPAPGHVARIGRASVFCAVLTVLFALTVMRNRVWS